jgi:hypothetical protein
MEPKMLHETLKYLSTGHRKQFQERRSVVEFRCFFTTLAFYSLTFLAIYKGEVHISGTPFKIFSASYLAVGLFSIIFMAYVHMAGNKDKELAERAEDGLRDIIGGRSCRDQDVKFNQYFVSWSTIHKKGKWGFFWQTITILCFAVISMLLVGLKN